MVHARTALAAISLIMAASQGLPAQDSVAVGNRVMVQVTSDHVREARLRLRNRTVVGEVVGSGDPLVVSTERDTLELPLTAVERLWVSTRRSRRANTAAIVAGIGLGTGLLTGYLAGEDCSENDFICFDRGELAVALGLAGAGIGAFAGAAFGGERWREIRALRASLRILPARQGALAVLTIRR